MRDASLDEFIGADDAGDGRDEPPADAGETAGDPAASEGAAGEGGGADDGAAGEGGGPTPGGAAGEGGAAAGRAGDGDAPEPAVSTFEWTPAGAACAACGSDVERRWREDGELVCADCKAW